MERYGPALEQCWLCQWSDRTDDRDRILRIVEHLQTHGYSANRALIMVAQHELRDAKARYGFPLDAGPES
jgi:hypothetical protein